MSSDVSEVTKERTGTYGSFSVNGPHAVRIFRAMREIVTASGSQDYDDCLEYALWMIATKVSRLAASPMHEDSILDIGGYAKILMDARNEFLPDVTEDPCPDCNGKGFIPLGYDDGDQYRACGCGGGA